MTVLLMFRANLHRLATALKHRGVKVESTTSRQNRILPPVIRLTGAVVSSLLCRVLLHRCVEVGDHVIVVARVIQHVVHDSMGVINDGQRPERRRELDAGSLSLGGLAAWNLGL